MTSTCSIVRYLTSLSLGECFEGRTILLDELIDQLHEFGIHAFDDWRRGSDQNTTPLRVGLNLHLGPILETVGAHQLGRQGNCMAIPGLEDRALHKAPLLAGSHTLTDSRKPS